MHRATWHGLLADPLLYDSDFVPCSARDLLAKGLHGTLRSRTGDLLLLWVDMGQEMSNHPKPNQLIIKDK